MEFINNYGSTRNGFFHTSKLFYNSELLSEARASYLNRTWEAYSYQSVMKQAVRNAIDNEIAEEKTKTELIELIEEVFTKVSQPLNVVASFSNGETIYAKA